MNQRVPVFKIFTSKYFNDFGYLLAKTSIIVLSASFLSHQYPLVSSLVINEKCLENIYTLIDVCIYTQQTVQNVTAT